MNRRFRLTRSTDFERVRRTGKSYAHPLIVLVIAPQPGGNIRFGVAAGRAVGSAVQRNRAKRLLRHAARQFLPQMKPGWDAVLIARRAMAEATFQQTVTALADLLRRARLLQETHDLNDPPAG